MTKEEIRKFQKHALRLCEDYETTTPESNRVVLIWFTPMQLTEYTKYVLSEFERIANKKNKTDELI